MKCDGKREVVDGQGSDLNYPNTRRLTFGLKPYSSILSGLFTLDGLRVLTYPALQSHTTRLRPGTKYRALTHRQCVYSSLVGSRQELYLRVWGSLRKKFVLND